MQSVFTGPVYVVRDNIDTDQIIPAQYLTLVPTMPDEYEKLGSYALAGLPESLYPARFVKDGQLDTEYPIVVGGKNFGCGSSREHAPIALGPAGAKSSSRRVSRASSFATASPPASSIPANSPNASANLEKRRRRDRGPRRGDRHRQGDRQSHHSNRSAMCARWWMPAACSITRARAG